MNLCFHIVAFTDSQLQSQNHDDTTISHEDTFTAAEERFIHSPASEMARWQHLESGHLTQSQSTVDGLGRDGQQSGKGKRANKRSASLGTPSGLLENKFR